ncbi:hypothetical protein QBC38DRAFT_152418 [Podospora fimiseda]|uniref:Integrase catalytic domain-containing protein n=1 Tax=Podospora fimiseda TaxID=252190 RepID=A0AAN6YKL0_9PEZI|nr:hypothetical protein QBC38DRAFT_152418 [Podospora fimiseda]
MPHISSTWSLDTIGSNSQKRRETHTHIIEFHELIRTQTGRTIKIYGFDGGGEFGQGTQEFQNGKIHDWAKERGIAIIKTTAHSPWQNGKQERAGRAITEKARAIMIDLKIPIYLWPFVVDSVVRVINLLPSKVTPNGTSPHEAFCKAVNMHGEATKPYIKHLRTYFCDAFYYIKPAHRDQGDKFSARARKGKLIGYGDLHGRIYWVWDPELHKIIRVNAVRFNETEGSETRHPESEEQLHEAVFVD